MKRTDLSMSLPVTDNMQAELKEIEKNKAQVKNVLPEQRNDRVKTETKITLEFWPKLMSLLWWTTSIPRVRLQRCIPFSKVHICLHEWMDKMSIVFHSMEALFKLFTFKNTNP